MTVRKQTHSDMQKFIDKGANVKPCKNKSFTNVLIRIPSFMLAIVDEMLESKPWLSRTQWMVEAINEKLKKEND